jgi:hypothetical protein
MMFPSSSISFPMGSQNVLQYMVPKNNNKQHKEYHNICVKVMFNVTNIKKFKYDIHKFSPCIQ